MHGCRHALSTLLTATALMPAAIAQSADPPTIAWQNDPARAYQAARQSNRPLLLLVTTQGCHYCTKMKQATYRDQVVVSDISDHFVAAEVDAMRHTVLAQKLGVRAYPTTVIISPDNRVVDVIRGYVDAPQLCQRMALARRHVRVANASIPVPAAAVRN